MTDLGPISQFLGLQMVRDRVQYRLDLHQAPYIEEILTRFQMSDCKGVWTPMESGIHLPPCQNDADLHARPEYQSKIGSVMYAMLGTRPDLAYTISSLSKHSDKPTRSHHIALQRVFRYLKKTLNTRIRYERPSGLPTIFPKPICYTDSDWAGDKDDRKSTGGYVFLLCGGAISWKTRKQDIVATSSTEAEYVALTEAAKEAVWLRRLLMELESRAGTDTIPDITTNHFFGSLHQAQSESVLSQESRPHAESGPGFTSSEPQQIYADNQGAIKLSENPQFHSKTKHIDLRYHYIRTARERGEVSVTYIPTAEMTADLLTKPLAKEKHWKHMRAMGMITT